MADQHMAKFGDCFRLSSTGNLIVMVISQITATGYGDGVDYEVITIATDHEDRPVMDVWGLFKNQWERVDA